MQLYVEPTVSAYTTPVNRLIDFRRVALAVGERKRVEFSIQSRSLAVLDAEFVPQVEPGEYKLLIGTNSVDGARAELRID